jgi:DNA-binding YbaB/EbfC family protein
MKARVPKNRGAAIPQNSNAMIRQAQKMQNDIVALQNEIEGRDFSASSGGGAVTISMKGSKEITSIKISPEAVKDAVDDTEMLEDLIISAINECNTVIDEVSEEEMNKITGGVSIPGLF